MAKNPSLRDRFVYVGSQWTQSLTFFCLVFGFVLGLTFILNPLIHSVEASSPYVRTFGTNGLVILGIAYVTLTSYTALYPERHANGPTIALLSGTGLIVALHPFSVIGVAFWTLAVLTVAIGSVRAVFRRRQV